MRSYGLSVTTMEEVFLNVSQAAQAANLARAVKGVDGVNGHAADAVREADVRAIPPGSACSSLCLWFRDVTCHSRAELRWRQTRRAGEMSHVLMCQHGAVTMASLRVRRS